MLRALALLIALLLDDSGGSDSDSGGSELADSGVAESGSSLSDADSGLSDDSSGDGDERRRNARRGRVVRASPPAPDELTADDMRDIPRP